MIWTIDTWVLMSANLENGERQLTPQQFLGHVLDKGHRMAINNEVWGELDNALQDEQSFSAKWFAAMNKSQIEYCFSEQQSEDSLKLRLREDLPAEVGHFDNDDIKFVVLCYRTEDRHLISGDIGPGDYSEPFTKWLHKEYDICFHD